MFLLLRSKRAALLYDGENTEDKPVSQKGTESECAVDVSSRISLVSSGGVSPPSSCCPSSLSVSPSSSSWLQSSALGFDVPIRNGSVEMAS